MAATAAQERLDAGKKLPIMAWASLSPAETNLERFLEMKEMGVNIALANYPDEAAMQKALDLAQEAGIKMVASCPQLKTDPEKTVRRFMNHPALAGYFLMDEPLKKDFSALGAWAKRIEDTDPSHFCFVNLIAGIHPTQTAALGTASFAEYISSFITEVPVKILSYDFYPVLNTGIHERWYESLGIVSREAQKAKKPFWAFALASSYNELHPTPTPAALRLQQYSNLAYGAQGLQYWSYRMTPGLLDAPIGADGRRTVVYDRIKELNNDIQNLADVFAGSQLKWVRHTGTIIPRGTERLEALPTGIKVLETNGEAIVSLLQKNDQHFLVIVNRSLTAPLTLILYGNPSLQKILKDGSIRPAAKYNPVTEIEPGDISVYRFPAEK